VAIIGYWKLPAGANDEAIPQQEGRVKPDSSTPISTLSGIERGGDGCELREKAVAGNGQASQKPDLTRH